MTEEAGFDTECFYTTDGEIAIVNLNSARLRSWSRFYQDPLRTGIAETILEHERLTAQFVGDFSALDRLDSLVDQLVRLDASSPRRELIQAQVASTLHRFSDARRHLAQASLGGAPSAEVKRLLLNIDQACGANLNAVLAERRQIARESRHMEDLVALGALLADLGEFADADQVYRQALREYRDVSPFPVARVCFQLGVLWGELVVKPQRARAEHWYRKAIISLPCYTKARVHLAEIYLRGGLITEAEATLNPAITSGDPEVRCRLADVFTAGGRLVEANSQLEAARSEFEALLERHLLAFADHVAEFYAGSGNDAARAFELARINVVNRPTLRAFEQATAIALAAGEVCFAAELAADASKRWGDTAMFKFSPLAPRIAESPVGISGVLSTVCS
jgi:tetratricopeptide (TPR) repeat protein